MKTRSFLTACLLLAALATQSFAQVSKSDFDAGISALGAALLSKDAAAPAKVLASLNGMMNTQMAYLTSQVASYSTSLSNAQVQAKADGIKATEFDAKAQALLKAATAATDPTKMNADIAAAQAAVSSAQAARADMTTQTNLATQLQSKLNAASANLATEKKSNDAVQSLRGDIVHNQNGIGTNLKLFSSTL